MKRKFGTQRRRESPQSNQQILTGNTETLLVNPGLSAYNPTSMRRKLVSNLLFQLSFGMAMARGVLVGLLLPGGAVLSILYYMSQTSEILPGQKTILINGMNHLTLSFISITAILALVNGLFGFLVSQRFAGPLTRIETWSVQHLMKQKPGTLKLREKDELGQVASSLNRIVSKYDEVEIS